VAGIGPDRDADDSDRELEEEHLRLTICLGFVEGASYIIEFRPELRTDENGQGQRRFKRRREYNSTLGGRPVLSLVSAPIMGWNSFINSYSP